MPKHTLTTHNKPKTPTLPWTITASALADFLQITGRNIKHLEEAQEELRGYLWILAESNKRPTVLQSGDHQYRIGRPLRARVIVRGTDIIEIKPDHENRGGPYTRSAKRRNRPVTSK